MKSDNEAATCCSSVTAPRGLEGSLRGIASRIGALPIRELPSGPVPRPASDMDRSTPPRMSTQMLRGRYRGNARTRAAHLARTEMVQVGRLRACRCSGKNSRSYAIARYQDYGPMGDCRSFASQRPIAQISAMKTAGTTRMRGTVLSSSKARKALGDFDGCHRHIL